MVQSRERFESPGQDKRTRYFLLYKTDSLVGSLLESILLLWNSQIFS